MAAPGTAPTLSQAVLEKIEAEAAKYPDRQAITKTALKLAQQEHGWLPMDLIEKVAEVVGVAPIRAWEVATFYDMLLTEPSGRHRIRVCTSVSCMLRGSDEVVAHLERRLGVGLGEVTADGRIALDECECLCACGGAPMMMVDHDYHENLTGERIDAIIDELD